MSAVYNVNNWLFSDDVVAPLLNVDTLGYMPVYPVTAPSQQEEYFVRYAFMQRPGAEHWLRQNIVVNYAIYGGRIATLYDIEQAIRMKVQSDTSAERLRTWVDLNAAPASYIYHDLRATTAVDLPAPEQEAADFGRMITIEFDFVPCAVIV